MTCASCPFYYGFHESARGECRRRAPLVIHDGSTDFPAVIRTAWCGEHPERAAAAMIAQADAMAAREKAKFDAARIMTRKGSFT